MVGDVRIRNWQLVLDLAVIVAVTPGGKSGTSKRMDLRNPPVRVMANEYLAADPAVTVCASPSTRIVKLAAAFLRTTRVCDAASLMPMGTTHGDEDREANTTPAPMLLGSPTVCVHSESPFFDDLGGQTSWVVNRECRKQARLMQ